MKKDRNCNMYPTMQVPMGPMMPYIPVENNYYPSSNDINNISNQLRDLERRVSNLEAMMGKNNSYNNSGYQMM